MAKVFIEETTLTAIGDAIREKEGTTELVPVNDMADRITAIQSGGGGGNEPTDEELIITGDCQYMFANDSWNWAVERYGNRMTTKDITNCYSMFWKCALDEIPFEINVNNCESFYSTFYGANISKCPKVSGTVKWSSATTFDSMLYNVNYLRYIDDLFTDDFLDGFSSFKVTSAYSAPKALPLNNLYSLRRIPSWWYKFRINEESTVYPTPSAVLYYNLMTLASLDEITNIPVLKCNSTVTSSFLSNSFNSFHRIKDLTFEVEEDKTPKTVSWKSQTISLTNYVGYAGNYRSRVTGYNSGITADKEVKDDATYQALKDDPDWFTIRLEYSRYNHDSAVNTINSLPDTSAYLASAGGTNTIKFKKGSGSKTDGGAISNLTAEEIAVAAAKGWTVTLS